MTTQESLEATTPHRTGVAGDLCARSAAALAALCAVIHLSLIIFGGWAMLSMTLPMLGLSVVCASCAPKAWRHRSTATAALLTMLVTAVVMLVLHILLSVEHLGVGHSINHGGMTAAPHAHGSGFADVLAHLALSLAVAQAALAAAAMWLHRRSPAAD